MTLCVVSVPLAQLLHVSDHAWAFLALAIVPFARGLEHLDNYRFQRELNYLPAALCEVIPHLVITLAAWPLAVWLGDFRVIVYLMVAKAVLGMTVTHVLAVRPYRWYWDSAYARRMWMFGWPLLLNSIAMFAAQQADQFIVAAFVSVSDLASYALALSLVSVPWFIFGPAASSVMLPILSRAQEDPAQFRRQYQRGVELAAVGAVVFMLPLIVAGEQVMTFLYGSKYSGTGVLVALLGAASAVRFLRFVPATAAMARADTINQLYSNLWRSISLPLAFVVAISGGGVLSIATCPLIAEIIAVTYSWKRLQDLQGVPLRDSAGVVLYLSVLIGVALVFIALGASQWKSWLVGVVVAGMVGISVLAGWLAFPQFARPIGGVLSRFLR